MQLAIERQLLRPHPGERCTTLCAFAAPEAVWSTGLVRSDGARQSRSRSMYLFLLAPPFQSSVFDRPSPLRTQSQRSRVARTVHGAMCIRCAGCCSLFWAGSLRWRASLEFSSSMFKLEPRSPMLLSLVASLPRRTQRQKLRAARTVHGAMCIRGARGCGTCLGDSLRWRLRG